MAQKTEFQTMTGGGLTGDVDLTPTIPSVEAGGLISSGPEKTPFTKTPLTSYGQNAASRWAGESSSAEMGFTPSGAGTVMDVGSPNSRKIKDWRAKEQNSWNIQQAATQDLWTQQQAEGLTSYMEPHEWYSYLDQKKAEREAKEAEAKKPDKSTRETENAPGHDIRMPGLHDADTYERRVAWAKNNGYSSNAYMQVFGRINARPQRVIPMSGDRS